MENKPSITKNYIYNITLTILNMIFPLITFPYVTRVLGADGIGKVAFANSIVNYFVMFAGLGIPVYGIREIAKVRNDKIAVDKIFSEIVIINFISTFIFSAIYYFSIFSNKLTIYKNNEFLFVIVGLILILNFINIDWLYQGFEQYKYITFRSLIFKVLSLVLLFITVRIKGDYVKYAALAIIAQSGSNILNIINCRKLVSFNIKNIDLKKHIRPIIIIFFMGIAINVYNNLDSTILGVISGDVYVGYYTAAVKINRMVISVITSLGVVLLPRLSYYIENDRKQFDNLLNNSIQYVLFITIPSCVGLFLLAPNIISLFSGSEFIPAISAMRINIPVILFVAIANVTSLQILLPLKKEKQVMITNIIAAVLNVILNMIFIPKYQQNGAAFSSAVSEFVVTILQIYLCKDYILSKLANKKNLRYIIGSIIIIIEIMIINLLNLNYMINMLISIVIAASTYLIYLIFIKDEIVIYIVNKIKR